MNLNPRASFQSFILRTRRLGTSNFFIFVSWYTESCSTVENGPTTPIICITGMAKRWKHAPQFRISSRSGYVSESNPDWKLLIQHWKGRGISWKSVLTFPWRALDASNPFQFEEKQSKIYLSPSHPRSSSLLPLSFSLLTL